MADLTISPLAPEIIPDLPAINGFEMASGAAGVRYQGRTDLWVLRAQPGTQIAGVFTSNQMPGAPIDWSKMALNSSRSQQSPVLLIVNSGNANVFTGALGEQACQNVGQAAAKLFDCETSDVFQASTGVIGEPLPSQKITQALPALKQELTANGWNQAAQAILTTDTFAKCVTRTATINGQSVRINGIAKGSGMIAPDMATMLGFIATDAAIDAAVLQSLLSEINHQTFNAITVDSDTSTSDMILLMASGAAGHKSITEKDDPALENFKTALSELMRELAHLIVRDGEGASKFVSVSVLGAVSDQSAAGIARAIANSPLVKTAIAGEDANWGRIVMAVGKAGEPADRDRLSVWLGPYLIAENGQLSPEYNEEKGSEYMKRSEINIQVDIGLGDGKYTAWTCDLTHGYININADYRS